MKIVPNEIILNGELQNIYFELTIIIDKNNDATLIDEH